MIYSTVRGQWISRVCVAGSAPKVENKLSLGWIRVWENSAHLQFSLLELRGFYSIINQSVNSPQKVKHPKIPQSSTASPLTQPSSLCYFQGKMFPERLEEEGSRQ